ncbi:alpha/beta fold hydrolase [Haliangium sp.]|uniref:alpha/beta fold hydrolase n=1 Tax=Haliangium sp. TaxID=2663208 RepID=UPI003D0C9157
MAVIRINGTDIAYDDVGHGPPVLLIHGLGSNRASWRFQVPALAEHYRVIRLDLRGHGDSGRPRDGFSVPAMSEDTAAFVRALGLDAVHLVGLSLGGMIGFQLAVDHPSLVRSMVIVNSGPEVVAQSFRERRLLATRLVLTRLLGPARLARLVARRLFPHPAQDDLRRELIASVASVDRGSYYALTRAIFGWGVGDRLDQVRCPVLAVTGDRDYTPVERKEAYVRRLADARLVVIPDSGHATPIDRPGPFNECLCDFLAAVTGVGAGMDRSAG